MEKFKILSIDGGGIKGLASAYWLALLEKLTNKPLYECFDLVIGTSTGAILAGAVGMGIPASEYPKLYIDYGNKIFPSLLPRIYSRVIRTFTQGLSAPKYSDKNLNKIINDFFQDKQLKELYTNTIFTSYNTTIRKSVLFKSYNNKHKELLVKDVVRASVAAPSYFSGHVINVNGKNNGYIDGGVVANNPILCGIAESKNFEYDLEDLLILSLGTYNRERIITNRQVKNWGALQWAIPIINIMIDGDMESSMYVAKRLIPYRKIIRVQTRCDGKMDDASNTNILSILSSLAKDKYSYSKIKKLAKML